VLLLPTGFVHYIQSQKMYTSFMFVSVLLARSLSVHGLSGRVCNQHITSRSTKDYSSTQSSRTVVLGARLPVVYNYVHRGSQGSST